MSASEFPEWSARGRQAASWRRASGAQRLTAGRVRAGVGFFASIVLALAASSGATRAETLSRALSLAYQGNPQLNAQRAATRAVDENLPAAMSGFRPTLNANAQASYQQNDYLTGQGVKVGNYTRPRSGSVTISQNLFNGNRTVNSVRQADSKILQSREDLRATESAVLNNAVIAYMGVLRTTAILDLRRNNISVVALQLDQTRQRYKYGEVTQTDVFQAESSAAQSRIDLSNATSEYRTALGVYEQVIGQPPTRLDPARPIEALLPRTLEEARRTAERENPTIQSAQHATDTAELSIKLAESQLLPTLGVTGSVAKYYDYNATHNLTLVNSSVMAQLNVPIYDGGVTFAQVRQAKEVFGQARLQLDQQRAQVSAAVNQAWSGWTAARASIADAQAQVTSAEKALAGIREDAKLGERTTFDVLIAQQNLVGARVQLVNAQYSRVVGSYSVLSAVGRLSAGSLGLASPRYDPTVHYDQVKDKWFGGSTPDGR